MGVYINMEMPKDGTAEAIVLHSDGAVGFLHEDDYRKLTAVPVPEHGDLIDRNETIKALWKALYEYEGRTEKQFVESSELDVADWILHRIFVQNMSDIDRQTILQMPTIISADVPGNNVGNIPSEEGE